MTVNEVIRELMKYPTDAEVKVALPSTKRIECTDYITQFCNMSDNRLEAVIFATEDYEVENKDCT